MRARNIGAASRVPFWESAMRARCANFYHVFQEILCWEATACIRRAPRNAMDEDNEVNVVDEVNEGNEVNEVGEDNEGKIIKPIDANMYV